MREQPARRVGLGVVADEDDRVEGFVETLHHAVTFEAMADQPRARIQIFRKEIALAAVRVVHDHFGGPARKRAANRRIRILGHQLA